MNQAQWQSDWQTFVEQVGRDFGKGMSEAKVSQRYTGKPVTWVGIVRDKQSNEFSNGVGFEMPSCKVSLPDGRWSVVDYLFVNVDRAYAGWKKVPLGAAVRFRAILDGNGPFPAIQWSSLESKKGVILLGAKCGELLEVLK